MKNRFKAAKDTALERLSFTLLFEPAKAAGGINMTRLIKYEFYKLFCKPSILVALILFSVMNLLKIDSEFHSYSYLADGNDSRSWNSVYWRLYENYRGEITAEKINQLLSLYQPLAHATADRTASTAKDNPDMMTGNIYSDLNILEKYYVKPMEYFYHYQTYALQVAERAKENAAVYRERGQTAEVRKNSAIYNLYAGRSIKTFAYEEMYNYYLNYDFSGILVLFLCLYGVVGTFVCEKETQMDMLLLTNPGGGKKTAFAKIAAAAFFVGSVAIWFSVVDYIGFAYSFGTTEGGNLPLYAVSNFSTAAVNCNLSQYAILSAVVRAVGVWTMSMVFLLISMFWRNALVPFVADFGIALCLIITGASQSCLSHTWLKIINPYSLLANRVLFSKTEFIGLAGYPIQSFQAAIVFAITLGLVSIMAMLLLSKRNSYIFCWTVKSRRRTRGTFMSALSNESSSH